MPDDKIKKDTAKPKQIKLQPRNINKTTKNIFELNKKKSNETEQ